MRAITRSPRGFGGPRLIAFSTREVFSDNTDVAWRADCVSIHVLWSAAALVVPVVIENRIEKRTYSSWVTFIYLEGGKEGLYCTCVYWGRDTGMKPVTEMPDGVYHKSFRTFGTFSHTPLGIMRLKNSRSMCVVSIHISYKVLGYFCTIRGQTNCED